MKKLLNILLLLSLSMTFFTCSSDDDNDTDEFRADPNFNPIKGAWVEGSIYGKTKLEFTADFKLTTYERENTASQWKTKSTDTYLINSTHYKLKSTGEEVRYWTYQSQPNDLDLRFANEESVKSYKREKEKEN